VRADDRVRLSRFDPEVEAAAYFVVCEALTNVVKHANATEAVVSLAAADGQLRLQVRDDGSGLGDRDANGQGLTNLRDRVEALGGRILVEGQRDSGTTLSTALPIRAGHG
jgi:signal transduction histidine kinase